MLSQRVLFSGVSVFDVVANQQRVLREKVARAPSSELDNPNLPERLAREHAMDVPILHEEGKYAKRKETQVDVSRDPTRRAFFGHGPRHLPGTEVSIFIPFSGDPGVFNVRPSAFDLNPPIGDVVGNELVFVYSFINEINLNEHERTMEKVKRYLEWLRPAAAQLDGDLRVLAQNLIIQRKHQVEGHTEALKSLGIPIREDALRPPARIAPSSANAVKRYRARKIRDAAWDVFICHATEDKAEIATPLAHALDAKGVSVWYDEFSLKLGDSLRESIDRGLLRSRFGVVILSPNFFEKHWPQKELNGLATRESDGNTVILPVWHNVGAEEVGRYSPMLADRFAVNTDGGLDRVVQKIMEAIR